MPSEREVLLQVRNLEVTFGKGRHKLKAVDDVSFDIYQGETFGLVGESGSGKTTIGRSIIRIYPTSNGTITFKGQRINGKIDKALDRQVVRGIQMIFQDPMASLNERAKVDYIVSEGLYSGDQRLNEAQRKEMVSKALTDVGLLPEFASRFPHEFSGGQRQRIGIAHLGAGRFHSGAGAQPAQRAAKAAWADLPVYLPRPVGHALYLRPHRGHP